MRPVALVLSTTLAVLISMLAVPAAQASGPRLDRGERAIISAINHQRSRFGLRALHGNGALARAADAHSSSMLARDYFSHGDFAARVRRYVRLRRLGETLAMTSRCSARSVVRMWMNSAPHRAVLLSPGFRKVGVGRRVGRLGLMKTCMVTADFGSRR